MKLFKKKLLIIRDSEGTLFRVLIKKKYIKEVEEEIEKLEKHYYDNKDKYDNENVEALWQLIDERILCNKKYRIQWLKEHTIMVE